MQKNNLKIKIFGGIILIGLGLFFRTVGHIAPNIEYVTAASLLAGAYLGRKYAILVPLIIMVLSDTLIGNTNIFLFSWSAYLIIGLAGSKYLRPKTKDLIPKATGLGITAALWFFLWTNFGVWALDSWGMYERNLSGLINSYFMGLPFLKLNLLGNLFFVPVSFGLVEMIKSFYASKLRNLDFLFRR